MANHQAAFVVLYFVFLTFNTCKSAAATTTPATTTPGTTTPSNTPIVSNKTAGVCEQLNANCGTCTDNSDCFWCEASRTCSTFRIIPKGCSKAKWFVRQCTISGFWVIIILSCAALFLIICCTCCCWCCCCRKDKEKMEEKYRLRDTKHKQEKEKRRAYHEERNQEREVERDRIRSKYGLYNTGNSGYQRFDNE